MKSIHSAAIIVALLGSTAAVAQPDRRGNQQDRGDNRGDHGNRGNQGNQGNNGRHLGWHKDRGPQHRWNRGERMGYNDWRGAQRVDYRRHNLRRRPRGSEWRQSNGQYILAAVATGVIISAIMNSGR